MTLKTKKKNIGHYIGHWPCLSGPGAVIEKLNPYWPSKFQHPKYDVQQVHRHSSISLHDYLEVNLLFLA